MRDKRDLIGESNTEAKEDAPDDEHPHGVGESVEESAGAEENPTEEHGWLPPPLPRHSRSGQR